ncbi:MAG: tRNA uridine(34) 5-carboxymethylaminomethyl modification radical SAM/GNAT enzyme Elp3 [Candidatus Woesearchaeota archaeon]|jgi:elongator complex protein 3
MSSKEKTLSDKEIAKLILTEVEKTTIRNHQDLQSIKSKITRIYTPKKFPTNIDLLCYATKEQYRKLRKVITLKPTRTLSGVAPIAVMAKPLPCPHGKCIFCPGGVKSHFGNVPQSYTGFEPSTMRSIRAKYDPYLIVINRLEQYLLLGHDVEKTEVIIQSGTFCAFPKKYQTELITYVFKALNDFSRLFFTSKNVDFELFKEFFELPCDLKDKKREKRITQKMNILRRIDVSKLSKKQVANLLNEKKIINGLKLKKFNPVLSTEINFNDKTSKVKCVGLTVETRPDYGRKINGLDLLKLGCTRIELGVQSVYDDVLKFVERGHDVKTSTDSIRELKDLGFKLNFHYMPGLCDAKKDLEGMKELFSDSNFRPDMLKIYPCMVLPGTKLADLYDKSKFKPINTSDAVLLISEFMKYVPSYCKIMRVQRDIPSDKIVAGVDKTNLRQMVDLEMKRKGILSSEIRSHESSRTESSGKQKIEIVEYDASNGKEFFISSCDDNSVFGFCRLRFPSDDSKIAFVRELHVYGRAQTMGECDDDSSQHKGIGKELMKVAENISKKNKKQKIIVISGVGVRGYYRKLGYKLDDTYMIKKI